MRLIVRLLVGIVAGILLGLFAPEWALRLLQTFRDLVGQLIDFSIPLIVLLFITSGIASLGRNGGRLLGITVGAAYLSTVVAGVAAAAIGLWIIPMLAGEGTAPREATETLLPFFSLEVPPLMSLTTALATAFIFGIGIAATNAVRARQFALEGQGVVEWLITRLIIPLLPYYIAGIFAELAREGTVFETLRIFGQVLLFAIVLHWAWLTVLFVFASGITRRSPTKSLITMLPAYFTALGTMSSAATIPVSLRQNKANGVRAAIADFAVPLFATIHLSGSTITIVSCSIAVSLIFPGLATPDLLAMIPFVMALGIAMIAAPGVPGGAVMAALALLQSMLGFSEGALGLMIALYLAQDSFGTACNVTGDCALAMLVDRAAGELPASADGESEADHTPVRENIEEPVVG